MDITADINRRLYSTFARLDVFLVPFISYRKPFQISETKILLPLACNLQYLLLCLVSVVFLLYTTDLLQLMKLHQLIRNAYADNTQIYGFCRAA